MSTEEVREMLNNDLQVPNCGTQEVGEYVYIKDQRSSLLKLIRMEYWEITGVDLDDMVSLNVQTCSIVKEEDSGKAFEDLYF